MDVGLDEEHDQPSRRRHGDSRARELGELVRREALGRRRDPVDRLDRRRLAADAHLEVGGTQVRDGASGGVDDADGHGRDPNLDLLAEDAARCAVGALRRGAASATAPRSIAPGAVRRRRRQLRRRRRDPGLGSGSSVRGRLVAHDDARGLAVARALLRLQQRGRDVVAGGERVDGVEPDLDAANQPRRLVELGAQVDRGRGWSEVDRPAAPAAAVERAGNARRQRRGEKTGVRSCQELEGDQRRGASVRAQHFDQARFGGRDGAIGVALPVVQREAVAAAPERPHRRPLDRVGRLVSQTLEDVARGVRAPPRLEAESCFTAARGLDRDLARVGIDGQRLVGAAALVEKVEGAGSRRRSEREEGDQRERDH